MFMPGKTAFKETTIAVRVALDGIETRVMVGDADFDIT